MAVYALRGARLRVAVFMLAGAGSLALEALEAQEACVREWVERPVTETGDVDDTSMEVDLATNAYVASVAGGRLRIRVVSADREITLGLEDPGAVQGQPDFAANSLGVTYLAYSQRGEGGGRDIFLADNVGGLFTQPLNVSQGNFDDFSPHVALDSSGEPHLTWVRSLIAVTEVMYWNPSLPQPSAVATGAEPIIYVDTRDVVHLVYRRGGDLLHNNNASLGAAFDDERLIVETPETEENSVSLGGDRIGNLFVAFEAGGSLFFVTARRGTGFFTPQLLDAGGVTDPEMRVLPNGQLAIVYIKDGDVYHIGGRGDAIDLPPAPVTRTAAAETTPSLALDLTGNVHMSFLRAGDTLYGNNACEPIAAFSTNVVGGEAPLEVEFEDLSGGDIKVWEWSFGDGRESSVPSPRHTYLDPGVYDVTLSVVGVGGRRSTVTRRSVVEVDRAANSLSIPDQRVLPGQVDVWFPVVVSHDRPIAGFQVLGKYEPEFLTYAGFSLDTTVTRVLAPEFLQVNDGITFFEVGCIFDFVAPFDGRELLPSEDKRLINIIFDVPSSAPQGRETRIKLENDSQISLVSNILTVGGFSITPKLRGSIVTIEPIRFPLPRLFIRGDVDGNRIVDITDAITLLNFQFLGGLPPKCEDTGDILDTGQLDITSAITLLNYLFLGGQPPGVPFPSLGLDPTPDGLADC